MEVVVKIGKNKGKHIHLPRDVAEALLLLELLEEPATLLHPGPRTRWQVLRGAQSGELYIQADCGTCRGRFAEGGPNAHKRLFVHCGVQEPAPRDVAEEFRKLYKDEKPQERKKLKDNFELTNY